MAPATDQFAHAVRELIPINGLPEQHQDEVLSHLRLGARRRVCLPSHNRVSKSAPTNL